MSKIDIEAKLRDVILKLEEKNEELHNLEKNQFNLGYKTGLVFAHSEINKLLQEVIRNE